MKILKIMIRKLICGIILISDKTPTFVEKVLYYFTIVATFAPIVYILDGLSIWFLDNKRFFYFVIASVIFNLVIGASFHLKNKTFNWGLLLSRNSFMVFNICVSYFILEALRLTGGNNIGTEVFKVVIQISTLLYPASKILKNLYILSNKQFPPKFIMERLYKFEKTGNMDDLYKNSKDTIEENTPKEIINQ